MAALARDCVSHIQNRSMALGLNRSRSGPRARLWEGLGHTIAPVRRYCKVQRDTLIRQEGAWAVPISYDMSVCVLIVRQDKLSISAEGLGLFMKGLVKRVESQYKNLPPKQPTADFPNMSTEMHKLMSERPTLVMLCPPGGYSREVQHTLCIALRFR